MSTTATLEQLDERNAAILADRLAQLDAIQGPRVGDWVFFADDVRRRISYIWTDERCEALSIQTSNGGSYYLGNGYVSMSGGLFPGFPPVLLEPTGETVDGWVWFFDHDHAGAGRGVDVQVPGFRVFRCAMAAPR
jgi:hypothetical protein